MLGRPKKSLKCWDNAHYTNGFLINFNIFDMVLTVNTYKNVRLVRIVTFLADWSDIDNTDQIRGAHWVTATAQGVTKKTNKAA